MLGGEIIYFGITLAGAGACIYAFDWISRTFTRICEEEGLRPESDEGGSVTEHGGDLRGTQTSQTHSNSTLTAQLLSAGEQVLNR